MVTAAPSFAIIVSALLISCARDADECARQFFSDVTNEPGAISSGRHAVGVSWLVRRRPSAVEVHGITISADGVMSPDIALSLETSLGTPGTTTMLWHAKHRYACGATVEPF